MAHRELPLVEGHESLSHSRRSCFRDCRRKFWLKYEQGIEPKELSAPLRMGGIYADALEFADPEIVRVKYNDLIAEAMHDGLPHMADRYLDELAVVVPMVVTYLDIVSTGDPREIEFTGRTNLGFQDNGRLDGLRLGDGEALIIENKLKGRWERAMEADVKLSEDQLTSYFLNIQVMHDLPADAIKARYEVAKKPQLRMKVNETKEAFRARVTADILSRPEFYHVVIEDITRTQPQLDEWGILFNRMTEDILGERDRESLQDPAAWPKNPSACSNYGGCEYAGVCWASTPEAMSLALESKFTTKES